MARVRKPTPTLESIFFATPEQKVFRLLLSEPTTSFTPRVISSKLKGVRGLGGGEGIMRVLNELQGLGLVDFVDNHRAVRLQDENSFVQIMKTVAAISDLETLKKLLEPTSTKGILFGSRASGKYRSDSDYDLFVVSETPEEVRKIGSRHPLQKSLELVVWTPEQYNDIEKTDSGFAEKLAGGTVLWGSTW
jgi:predicted nucleotidyltransferase